MQNIIFDFVIGAMSVAGFSIIWRNWVEDHPAWERIIRRVFGKAHKILTCGPCFTYWAALVFTLLVSPLGVWMPFGKFFLGIFLNLMAQWMALAWLSVFLRFLYVALQQYVRKNLDV